MHISEFVIVGCNFRQRNMQIFDSVIFGCGFETVQHADFSKQDIWMWISEYEICWFQKVWRRMRISDSTSCRFQKVQYSDADFRLWNMCYGICVMEYVLWNMLISECEPEALTALSSACGHTHTHTHTDTHTHISQESALQSFYTVNLGAKWLLKMRTSMALGHLMGTWWSARRRVRTVPMTALTYLHVCNMTRSCVWHHSFMCVAWLIHVCHMTRPRVWHDSFMSHHNQFSTILARVLVRNFITWLNTRMCVRAHASVCEI